MKKIQTFFMIKYESVHVKSKVGRFSRNVTPFLRIFVVIIFAAIASAFTFCNYFSV